MRYISAFALSTAIVLYAVNYILVKVLFAEVPPISIALLRAVISIPLLLAVALHFNPDAKAALKHWKAYLLLGLAGTAVYQTLQNIGLQLTTAADSSVLLNSDAVFIAILGFFFLKESLNKKQAAGIAIAFAGVSAIVLRGGGTFSLTSDAVLGDVIAVLGALSWAVFSVYGKKVMDRAKVNAYDLTAYSAFFGAALLLPLAFGFEAVALPSTTAGWVMLLVLGLGSSGVAYLCWFVALNQVSAYKAGISLFFTPIISVAIAMAVLGETIDLIFVAGTALVIMGMFITIRKWS